MKNKQLPRLQISTAVSKEDWEALHQCQSEHGLTMAQIIKEGINAVNNREVPSESVIMDVVKAGLRSLNEPIPHCDLTDTTPGEV